MSESGKSSNEQGLETIVREFMKEIRAERRKNWFFRGLLWVYLLGSSGLFFWGVYKHPSLPNSDDPHIAEVQIVGPIERNGGVSAEKTNPELEKAFKNKETKAVVLDMDSPGGAAAQSDMIYREVLRLKGKYPQKKVYAVVGDVCASGCYFIASAADEILVDPTSMVGNIGVRMDGFDFTGLMQKLGVKRRILHAGENKILADPFSKMPERIRNHLQKDVLDQTRQVFIDAVKKGRGDRLKLNEYSQVLSGYVYVGGDAIKRGLADGIGDIQSVKAKVGGELPVVNYTPHSVSLSSWLKGQVSNLTESVFRGDTRLEWDPNSGM